MKVGDLVGFRIRLVSETTQKAYGGWVVGYDLDALEIKLTARSFEATPGRWLAFVVHSDGEVVLPVRLTKHDGKRLLVSVVGFAQLSANKLDARQWHWKVHELVVNDMDLPVMVSDISANGIGIVSEHFIAIGTRIKVEIPGRNEDFLLAGTVIHASTAEDSGLHRLGVQLDQMDRATRARWNVFLNGDEPLLEKPVFVPDSGKKSRKDSVRILRLAS